MLILYKNINMDFKRLKQTNKKAHEHMEKILGVQNLLDLENY